MYNRFNFKTAGVKLANPANPYQYHRDFILSNADNILSAAGKPFIDQKSKPHTDKKLIENIDNTINGNGNPYTKEGLIDYDKLVKYPDSSTIVYNPQSEKLEYKHQEFKGTSTKENPMDSAEKEVQNLASGKPTEQKTKSPDFDWKRLINFNDPYFQYYTMPTALGLGIGGMFGGWKGAMLGGLGSLATGALAKYLGENYDMTPKSSTPATQTTSPAAPVSTSNIA